MLSAWTAILAKTSLQHTRALADPLTMHSARSNAYGLPNASLPAQLNLSLSTHLLALESVTVTVIDFHQGGLESVTEKSPYFHSDALVHLNESTCRTATCQLAPVDFSALQMSYLSPVGASPSAATGLISRGKAVLPTILDFLGHSLIPRHVHILTRFNALLNHLNSFMYMCRVR